MTEGVHRKTRSLTDQSRAWPVLLAAAAWRRRALPAPMAWALDERGGNQVREVLPNDKSSWLQCSASNHWQVGAAMPASGRDLVELYLPLLAASPDRPVIVGHLGQSVDARIATSSGDSAVVTGAENFLHLHRMRALCDAIVIGAGTAAADDPQLTTRQVDGPNPVRVVIDPAGSLPSHLRIFTDEAVTTLIACDADAPLAGHLEDSDVIRLPRIDGQLSPMALREALVERRLNAVFVEGGGLTVSRWMQAGALTRLQIAVAPVLVGEGRDALQLPPVLRMRSALRPPYRLYRMGDDVFWDFDLTAHARDDEAGNRDATDAEAAIGLVRLS